MLALVNTIYMTPAVSRIPSNAEYFVHRVTFFVAKTDHKRIYLRFGEVF